MYNTYYDLIFLKKYEEKLLIRFKTNIFDVNQVLNIMFLIYQQ